MTNMSISLYLILFHVALVRINPCHGQATYEEQSSFPDNIGMRQLFDEISKLRHRLDMSEIHEAQSREQWQEIGHLMENIPTLQRGLEGLERDTTLQRQQIMLELQASIERSANQMRQEILEKQAGFERNATRDVVDRISVLQQRIDGFERNVTQQSMQLIERFSTLKSRVDGLDRDAAQQRQLIVEIQRGLNGRLDSSEIVAAQQRQRVLEKQEALERTAAELSIDLQRRVSTLQQKLDGTDRNATQLMLYVQELLPKVHYRLADKSTDGRAGRLEILHFGVWGTVCDDNFSNISAIVACRSLGFDVSAAQFFSGAYYGQGSGPILLDDVSCTGNELRLTACGHLGWGRHNCGHSEDVSVSC